MKMQESLTTSRSLENALVEGRLDIPAGAELSPALRRLVEEVRMEDDGRDPHSQPYTTACTTGTIGDKIH